MCNTFQRVYRNICSKEYDYKMSRFANDWSPCTKSETQISRLQFLFYNVEVKDTDLNNG